MDYMHYLNTTTHPTPWTFMKGIEKDMWMTQTVQGVSGLQPISIKDTGF